MDADRIGIQLYTFLSEIRSDDPGRQQENLRRVLATIAGLGYRNVENFAGTWGWTAAEYRRELEAHGLRAVGEHGELDPATFDERLEHALALGLEDVGSSGWPAPGLDTAEHTLETAAALNMLGERASAHGLRVYGHNHAEELATKVELGGERVPALEVVIMMTDPNTVTFELDVHWAWTGLGLDRFEELLAFLRRHGERIGLLHVKGTTADGSMTDAGGPDDATDWPAVFAATPHVRYFHQEYDFPPDPGASAATTLAFLQRVAQP